MSHGSGARLLIVLALLPGCKPSVPDSGLRLVYGPAPGAEVTPNTLLRLERVFDKRVAALEIRGARVTANARTGRVTVDIPGGRAESAKRLLGRTGRLELRVVEDRQTGFLADAAATLPGGVRLEQQRAFWNAAGSPFTIHHLESADGAALGKAIAGLKHRLPRGTELLVEGSSGHHGPRLQTYLVSTEVELTGDYVVEAEVRTDEMIGNPYVAIELDERGAKIFEDLTARIVKRRLAIVIDGAVNSAPVVQERIAGGRLQITLGGMRERRAMEREAEELAMALWSGALPCPVVLLEETIYGPASR